MSLSISVSLRAGTGIELFFVFSVIISVGTVIVSVGSGTGLSVGSGTELGVFFGAILFRSSDDGPEYDGERASE